MFGLLQYPIFRRLYAAHVIHILGNEFTFIAVLGLLHDLSGSGLTFAAGTVFRFVPYVITSFFTGPLIEKWDKRKLMVLVNFFRAILVSLYFWISDPSYLWVAFLLMVLMNICGAFFQPAMQVAIVQTVETEQRLVANSLLQGTTSFLIIVCQGIAAFLVYYFSYRFNFLLDAACYLFSMLILLRLPTLTGTVEQLAGSSFSERLREGFRYVRGHGEIRRTLLFQMAERICGAYYILLMFYVLQERGEGLYVFGILDIPLGLGGVLAGLVVGKLAEKEGERGVDLVLGWSLVTMAVSIFFMFHAGPLSLLMVTTLFCAFASYSSLILSVTRLQTLADPSMLARLFSIREMATMGSFSIGCLLVGYGAERFGSAFVSFGLAIWGIMAGVLWLYIIRSKAKTSASES